MVEIGIHGELSCDNKLPYLSNTIMYRYATLDAGIVAIDYITEAIAFGKITYDVPAPGTMGTVTLMSQVFNGHSQYIFQNSGEAYWSTPSTWTKEGYLNARSAAKVYGTMYNWNAEGTMTYGNNQYNLVAYENDYGVGASTSDVTNNEFYLVGSGGYGGSGWNNW
jgi:hypothetical protein